MKANIHEPSDTNHGSAAPPPEGDQPVGRWAQVRREVVALSVCIAVVLLTRASFADHYVVPSGSMQPTVEIGDRVLVSKVAYGLRLPLSDTWVTAWDAPSRGDVVVLESPESGIILLKRVVGVPGDTIAVREGELVIGGQKMAIQGTIETLGNKSHEISFESGGGPDFGPTRLPEGKFLVMGDNRGNSRDGRMFGLVDRERILGRAERIYYHEGAFSWLRL